MEEIFKVLDIDFTSLFVIGCKTPSLFSLTVTFSASILEPARYFSLSSQDKEAFNSQF